MRRALTGRGRVDIAAHRDQVWSALLDPEVLRQLIPGAEVVRRLDPDRYQARLSFGVAGLRGRYDVRLQLVRAERPGMLDLAGSSRGLLGGGRATARVELTALGDGRTTLTWCYDGAVTGPVAWAGPTLLRASSTWFVDRFFAAFAQRVAMQAGAA